MEAFAKIEKTIKEAEEFFWYITNELLGSANVYTTGLEALDRGVEFRCIEPIGYKPPRDILDNVSKEVWDAYDIHRSKGLLLDRKHETIDVILYMNEKEVAVLDFPELTGAFDYLGFTSSDPKVLDWCKDLHSYYWDKGILRLNFL
jgi:predicted transcriptional regulator